MKLLELTLPTPAENLALDEALLETAEAAGRGGQALRLWESPTPMVVVGRASQIEAEVDVAACRELGVPIFRRHSGGAAVVAGPGCLMYAVVLSYQKRPHLRMIDDAHRFVLETLGAGLRKLERRLQRSGISDLTLDGRMKISGNSLRCCRTHLLYHGTLLYDFPLELIGRCLKQPPRQPDYRARRTHGEFVANLALPAAALRAAIVEAWRGELTADEPNEAGPHSSTTLADWPRELTAKLAEEKYSTDAWNFRR